MSALVETNFDGLVGPTHNYAGLSTDNVASRASRHLTSDPRAAALEGIAKMRTLMELGVPQAVLPPHERPHLPTLRALGFSGDDAAVLAAAAGNAPGLLAMCASASAMWAANAATVTASADSTDRRLHLSPANLVAHAHRAIEAPTTTRVLRAMFADRPHVVVHDPLPGSTDLADEGAANHVRLGRLDGAGVHLLVYGRDSGAGAGRQTLAASQAIARRHGVTERAVFARQHPRAVRAGAFHNDVVAVGRADVLLCHERSYVGQRAVLARLAGVLEADGVAFRPVIVPETEVSLDDAVRAYLFNGQLVADGAGRMTLVVPAECHEVAAVDRWLRRLDPDGPIAQVVTVDVRQSMRNGGGPACLRLCVPLAGADRPLDSVMATPRLLDRLEVWVRQHYRDRLVPADLADPSLLGESRAALDELSTLLGLGAVFDFQRDRA